MSQLPEPHHTRQRLDVPAEAAWNILTSLAGARRWLGNDSYPGIAVGAPFPVRGSRPAEITAISPTSIEMSFPAARRAVLELCAIGDFCEIAVTDYGGDSDQPAALAEGWSALLRAAKFVVDQVKAGRRSCQAIVVIHGIGSQRPLATIKGFTDALVARSERWSKPDQVSRSYELRRYQLRRTAARPRTDFFELYWADKMPGTKLGQTLSWSRSIILRRPRDASPALRPIAYLSWAVILTTAAAAAALLLTIGFDGLDRLWHAATGLAKLGWVSASLSVVGGAVSGFLTANLGDAARYLDNAPDNIAVRQSVRQSGLELLRRLHADGRYDRIVVVGHSLGSVIGYDILRLYWSQIHQTHGTPLTVSQECLRAYELLLANAAKTGPDLTAYRRAQKVLWREYRRHGHPWLITDLVTIGSPLTHAATLLARSPADLEGLKADLELPTCPPQGAPESFTQKETYFTDGQIRTIQMPTHGALFALTRWTNIYAPAKAMIFGDPIGGPVAPIFGTGVKDIAVRVAPWWRRYTPIAHTSYWHHSGNLGKASAIQALKESLDIESRQWLNEHVSEMPWEAHRLDSQLDQPS